MIVERLDNNNSIFKSHTVTLEDLPWLFELGEVQNGAFELIKGIKGGKLKTPASIPLSHILEVGQEGLIEYIVKSLVRERPKLIPFVFRNQTVVGVANYLKRYRSGSLKTLYLYADSIERFSKWAGREPDAIISDVKLPDGMIDPAKLQIHIKALGDFVAHLQDKKFSPNRILNYVKAVKALYRTNQINIDLPYPLPQRVVKRDRAPKQEELQKLMDIADLRERVIISMLALGGFREGTLVQLRYRHVKHDLEEGIVPVHIHVEADITKGKYGECDTFLGPEAVHYLKLYLDMRRKGTRNLPPEEITDESPLIRNANSKVPEPIGEKQLYQRIHRLYEKAGLLQKGESYQLRVHSIRKFFKTQLLALGVQPDYVDYMMSHKVDTYHDVSSKVDDLSKIYATANFSISPKRELSKPDLCEALKTFAKGLGLDPDKVVREEAFAEPHRVVVGEGWENEQISLLSLAIKDAIKKEVLAELPISCSPPAEIQAWGGAAAGI